MLQVKGTSVHYWLRRLDDDVCLRGVIVESLKPEMHPGPFHSAGAAGWPAVRP